MSTDAVVETAGQYIRFSANFEDARDYLRQECSRAARDVLKSPDDAQILTYTADGSRLVVPASIVKADLRAHGYCAE